MINLKLIYLVLTFLLPINQTTNLPLLAENETAETIVNIEDLVVPRTQSWNDLKIKWGLNIFDTDNYFVSMPRTVANATRLGWLLEKDCSQVLGNRYILNGDRGVMLIFDNLGFIAGIAAWIPKGLPFDFPSSNVKRILNDEGGFFSISVYFSEPDTVCTRTKMINGDRLVLRNKITRLNVPLDQVEVADTLLWSPGQCFQSMGFHYWADLVTGKLTKNTPSSDFLPFFIFYNKGKLNGFGWAFNAIMKSQRYERPSFDVIEKMFRETPSFIQDTTQSGGMSFLHIYFDSTPILNNC